MGVMKRLCLALLPLLLLSLIPKSTPTPTPTYVYSFCPNTTMFAPNSTYHTNLNSLLQFLSKNCTNPKGFQAAHVGNYSTNPDAIDSLFLCRGDLNVTTCSNCVDTAIADLADTYCPDRKVAYIWYDECMVRYSSQPIFRKLDTSRWFYKQNPVNTTGSQTGFRTVLEKTMLDVATQAATTDPLVGKKFATMSDVSLTDVGSDMKLYLLAQCTPDLSSAQCSECLAKAIVLLPTSDGARLLLPSCNVRYETYQFFSTASLEAPAPAPGPMLPSLVPDLPKTSPAAMMINNTMAPSPGTSASSKMIPSPYFNIFVGFGIFALVNLHYLLSS